MMGFGKVKLFGMWAAPAVRRVEWALKMKGIEYEYVEEDLTNKSVELLEYNPINKQVPVLLHDGRPIVESLIILEYIDEVWKENPIMPEDPYERAMARSWANFVEDKLKDAAKNVFFAEGEEREKAIGTLEEIIGLVDEELRGKKFFGGDSIGYLDLAVGWLAFWLAVSEEVAGYKVVDSNKFAAFVSWIENFVSDPVIRENLPPRSETVEFFRSYRRINLLPKPDEKVKVFPSYPAQLQLATSE